MVTWFVGITEQLTWGLVISFLGKKLELSLTPVVIEERKDSICGKKYSDGLCWSQVRKLIFCCFEHFATWSSHLHLTLTTKTHLMLPWLLHK